MLLVASRFGPLDGLPGRPVEEVRLTPQTAPVVDRLVAAARSAPVRRSAEADDLPARLYPPLAALADKLIDDMATSPSEALTSTAVLRLLLDGYLDSPTFDRADLRAMLDAAPEQRTLWTDDRVGVLAHWTSSGPPARPVSDPDPSPQGGPNGTLSALRLRASIVARPPVTRPGTGDWGWTVGRDGF